MERLKIMTVYVEKDGCFEVIGNSSSVCMLSFHGYCRSEFFNGNILPGAVDTQRSENGKFMLSARYIIEGTDKDGNNCRLFIENNGSADENGIYAVPKIITDSPSLVWLESAELESVVCEDENGLRIEFFKKS